MMNRKKPKVFEMAGMLNTDMVYVIYANADRLKKHRHAWKAWHTLKDFGCKVFAVAPGLTRFEGSKIYNDLAALQGKVDVVVPCLKAEYLTELVSQCAEIGVKSIWFQEKNWTEELETQCQEVDIQTIRGCLLKHKIYAKPFAFFNPCYWHGRKENKVPSKYQRR